MKNRFLFWMTLLMFLITGCYLPGGGKVIDADTGTPVEGAVVMVEWTKTHGIGDHWTESYKVAEAMTDKDGTFILSGCYSPFANEPDVTVYKKGYVAWSSRWIFPGWQKRTDFKWAKGFLFKLEKFKNTYSYVDHDGFISRSTNDTIGWENKKLFFKTYFEAEESLIIRERSERDRNRQRHANP